MTRLLVVALAASLSWIVVAGTWASGVYAATTAPAALHVSFDPAASVRLKDQRFVAAKGVDVDAVNAAVGGHPGARIGRLFSGSPARLDARRQRLLARGRRAVPDLNRHYRIVVGDRATRDDLLRQLRALAVVDEAIPEPAPAPPPTGDYTGQQRYGFAAPVGIGAGAIAGLPGGQGQGVKIIDIEYSWNRAHEDLTKAAPAGVLIPNGTPADPFNDSNHGTAVLGELIATPNAFGVTGLAHGSDIGVVNAYNTQGYFLANAVSIAAEDLSPGDVMLLEQQAVGINGTGSQSNPYVPVEWVPSVYDAIKLASQDGIIVVEAAGNGGVDLDHPAYGSPFPSGQPDSGAIIVGAGGGDCNETGNQRLAFSTYGARVNVQGWGQCVTTTGIGNLFNGGPNALYTATFSGTSSASPIVASAAALFSGVFQATTGGTAPTPQAVRSRLIATGTPQPAISFGHIGPLPDAQAATSGFDFTAPTVQFTAGPTGVTNDPTPTFAFSASEAGSTFECRVVGVTSFAPCTSPYTTTALPDGPRSLEVVATDPALNPGPAAARAFFVDTVAPTAVADAYEHAGSDRTHAVTAPGVLSNDSDPGGDTLTAALVSGASHGALTLAASGAYTYRPDEDYVGSDSFTYRASDGANPSNVVTVTLTVLAGCGNVAATIVGTSTGETLNGTAGDDVIAGLGGDDVLLGGGGDDTLCGGAGADTLRGGADDDNLRAGAGDDSLDGSSGADILRGEAGSDLAEYASRSVPITASIGNGAADDGASGEHDNILSDVERVRGGTNDDVLTGNASANRLYGRTGDDTLNGAGGADVLYGEAGNDTVNGDAGADTLFGGEQDDDLHGGADNDTLDGQSGADTLTGDDGSDVASYSSRTVPVTASIGAGADDGAAGENDAILSDVERVMGGSAGDTLTGDGGRNTLYGRGGDDTLTGGTATDFLYGDAGDDTLDGADVPSFIDRLYCGAGTDATTTDAKDTTSADCE